MKHVDPYPNQALSRFASRLKLRARPIRRFLRACAHQGAIPFAAGYSRFGLEVPTSATPLTVSDTRTGIDASQLCRLYKQHPFLDAAIDSRSSPDWKLKSPAQPTRPTRKRW